VSVALEGTLDPESWYVFNFVDLKQVMKRLCDEIDHRVLLPLENPKLQIGEQAESITVAYQGRPRYVLPREDCVLLPIPNTTAEMLAQYLAGRLKVELGASADRLASIEIEVEESFGQSAVYRETLSRSPDLRTGMGSG
jgi:6-pyruvoyltetrahydropterin/6-carboxytetrahydropterin synthase